jgi:hypothetical protein
MLTLLCTLVVACPIGTNLGLLHLLWMPARTPFPQDFPLPAHLREKASAPAHLPTGFWGQRRTTATPATPTSLAEAT